MTEAAGFVPVPVPEPPALRTRPWPPDARTWLRFLLGLALVYALFEVIARSLDSDRGQFGLVVGLVVVSATALVDSLVSGEPLAPALRRLGFGLPTSRGMLAAVVPCVLLVLSIVVYIRVTESSWTMYPGWQLLLPGLFAQAGIAEETLFRGYLFGRLRPDRSFIRAALVAMVPFLGVHLGLFLSMPFPVASASVLLSAVIAFPLAYLYDLGGRTIWASALLHFVVQAGLKVVVVDAADSTLAVTWIAGCALLPFMVFFFRGRLSASHAAR